MSFVIGLLLLLLVLTAVKQFARMDAATVARLVRHGGGVLGLVGAGLLLMRGRIGIATALAGMAATFAGWRLTPTGWTSNRGSTSSARSGRVSMARSAMIETRLDLGSGVMSGEVLAGAFAGKALESLSGAELFNLRADLGRDDPDGLSLLEAYLDRRFPGWREADQGQREEGGRGRSSGGAMSRRQALEVLGLPEGASAAEIIRAHRALMKKLHPDHGGSTALAAKVNQAKDVLMQGQD